MLKMGEIILLNNRWEIWMSKECLEDVDQGSRNFKPILNLETRCIL